MGVVRGEDVLWQPPQSAENLTRAEHDNLRNLGLDHLDVVNMRLMGGAKKKACWQSRFQHRLALREQGIA